MEKKFEEKFGLETEEMEKILGGVVEYATMMEAAMCESGCAIFCSSCVGCTPGCTPGCTMCKGLIAFI